MTHRIIDNKQNGILGDVVKEHLRSDSKMSIILSYFTIFAFNHLKDEHNNIDEIRFLLTSNPYSTNSKNNSDFLNPSLISLFGNEKILYKNECYAL